MAIAFAASARPVLLLADEPIGQLDHSTVDSLLTAFTVFAESRVAFAESRVAIVAATHDPAVARRADQAVHLRDGRVPR